MMKNRINNSEVPSSDTSNIVPSNWYLLQMKPTQHYRGLNNLVARGYECFSPDITIKKLRKGKKVNVTEPLFPGYVFIKLERNCNWQSVAQRAAWHILFALALIRRWFQKKP